MTLTQLKLKAIVLTAYMNGLREAQLNPTPEHERILIDFNNELILAEMFHGPEMDSTIADDLDGLLAAIDSIPEVGFAAVEGA